jgi:hypothetical protein
MAIHPWPAVPEEHRRTIELLEELLAETDDTPDELANRARELRDQAAATKIKGQRDASLALADRYDEAAAARLAVSRP